MHTRLDGAVGVLAERISIVSRSVRAGSAFLKLGLTSHLGADTARERWALAQCNEIVSVLARQSCELSRIKVYRAAKQIGVRTGRRALGRQTLTDAIVLRGWKSPEGVANGAWPMER